MDARREHSSGAPDAGPLRVRLACPGCGGPIELTSTARAVCCPFCESSHLVSRTGGASIVSVSDRAGELGGELLLVPYAHLAARIHEVVFGLDRAGRKHVAAAAVRTELIAPAADLDGLPPRSPSSALGAASPFQAGDYPGARFLPAQPDQDVLAAGLTLAAAARLVPELSALTRQGLVAGLESTLLLWPFRLIGEGDNQELVDAHAPDRRQRIGVAAARALRDAARPAPPPAGRFVFRPMRCAHCASAFPLEAEEQIRFCPGCFRAQRADGSQMVTTRYRVERPAGSGRRISLPFWRFSFELADPRDGRGLASPGAVAEALGGPAPSEGRNAPFLDVAAFLPEDRAVSQRSVQRLAAPPPSLEETVEGPARPEWDLPRPERFVAILPDEAAAIARTALALTVPVEALQGATAARFRKLVLEAPLELSEPRLVLRAFRPGDAAPLLARYRR